MLRLTRYLDIWTSFKHLSANEAWYSDAYKAEVVTIKPVVEIEGVELGFKRAVSHGRPPIGHFLQTSYGLKGRGNCIFIGNYFVV